MDGPLGESKYIQSGNFTDQGPIFTHDVPFDNVSGSIAFTLAKRAFTNHVDMAGGRGGVAKCPYYYISPIK